MLKEFKKFALKGNMIDLAVGMIIGTAFNKLVSSLVNDMFMPLLGILTGKIDFTNLFIALDGNKYATLAEAQELGVATVNYGSFISGLINFLIMAFVVFFLVKGINKLRTINEKPAEPAKADPVPLKESAPAAALEKHKKPEKAETNTHKKHY